ncbi:MAG TPA: Amuc_1099 family pilus-like system protein [Chthoniobacterales bacterium]|nr:Amuc_1099 family pilus-like system protein [Chthoniobacterales bacterium]
MTALREHYERGLLVAAAGMLFVSSFFIWRNAVNFRSQFRVMPAAPALKSASPMAKAQELDAAIEKLHQPSQWTFGGRSGLFVPEKYFIAANGLPATLQTTEVHPPVPNEWLEEFGLPITDADVLDQDPDKDSFNNLEEWTSHTNPTDSNSHPEYYTKLKLKSASEEPFRLVFSSWVDDAYAINTIDMKQPTQFVKVGDLIKGTRFKVAKFVEKYQPNQYGTNVDVSELTLEQAETRQELTLIKEKVATSPESVATFIYTWGGRREFQVRKDQEFSLKPQDNIHYKLIDVGPTKAVIANSQRAEEQIEIGVFNPSSSP